MGISFSLNDGYIFHLRFSGKLKCRDIRMIHKFEFFIKNAI